jgi:hypothetical protein
LIHSAALFAGSPVCRRATGMMRFN